ncbi:hypothetical protein TW95_gp1604 [Pandoravirus inopinatum]|uniref:Uncharacterized protein n=1 Tax=Pandoravirus inopinatum TaxID=1605721 RepID=A0A0B5IZK5_9VIRU|nr:hypothetical protein TW95_gp1604 [Pandoravirus inopinatum]AJF98338.1 hypothetical protein [Pandoravirus inopinatum]
MDKREKARGCGRCRRWPRAPLVEVTPRRRWPTDFDRETAPLFWRQAQKEKEAKEKENLKKKNSRPKNPAAGIASAVRAHAIGRKLGPTAAVPIFFQTSKDPQKIDRPLFGPVPDAVNLSPLFF